MTEKEYLKMINQLMRTASYAIGFVNSVNAQLAQDLNEELNNVLDQLNLADIPDIDE